ncbi:DEAD/DEAH box helicase [bacterium]|nr:DEAD/DEAH box helicase [bacterium]
MNIFETHAKIIDDYATYIRSFLNIDDQSIRSVVETELNRGKLWPEPLLQFNPSFQITCSVKDLTRSSTVHKNIADAFKGYDLYEHQVKAIKKGINGEDFVVTSGTGSGKSLTYIGTVFNHLFSNPDSKGVTAVIVYPMNALINSQFEEFKGYKEKYEESTGINFPVTFGQYTGQEKEDVREKMRDNPPHILLTNYMMLELILTRLRERPIRDAIYQNITFLVFDELHTYRGRQGADVSMLIRRLRTRSERELICIGTSATMVSVGNLESQREEVAKVASTIFGKNIKAHQIINEVLTRSLNYAGVLPSADELSTAIKRGINNVASINDLKNHPVAIWLENNIAIEEINGDLIRKKPQTLNQIVDSLAKDSGCDKDICLISIIDLIQWISHTNSKLSEQGKKYTYLPFKLHQFISQTGSVYTTLDQDENRYITLEPGIFKLDESEKKPIFPNVFSRASGHAFICVSRIGQSIIPREFRESNDENEDSTDGYLIVGNNIWDPEDDIDFVPESWIRRRKAGAVPDSKKKAFFPIKLYFDEYGNCSEDTELKWWGWFMKAPLLFDPTAGLFYDTKTNEGTKLTKLGSEGRSTSTTITAFSILNQLNQSGYLPVDQKLLSFTDNRQDAALQAGHFNDFVQIVKLRAAIFQAIDHSTDKTLTYASLGEAVFQALGLPFLEFANRKEEPALSNIRRSYEQQLQNFLMYRAIADLKRSWRIILPNLEQCGLLEIDYLDLEEVAEADEFWAETQFVNRLNSAERKDFLCTILDFFRLEYAIHSENYLTQSKIKENEKHFREMLKPPWTLDRNEDIHEPYFIRLDPLHSSARFYSKSMGPASALGKYLKLYANIMGIDVNLKGDNYRVFILDLMNKLEEADYLKSQTARNKSNEEIPIYRLRLDKILWRAGDGETVKADLIKRRSYKDQSPRPNEFFREIYQRDFTNTKRLRGEDHTGQLGTDTRIEREDLFRNGEINALFCSPTMELGIDIGGLSVVHLRNAPPNPSNYAQRSGRAGRSGQGALIFTYCSSYSPHDRHYFEYQSDLVAGIVQAPKLDLCNKELLLTHLNAVAISEIGMPWLENQDGCKPSLMKMVVDDNNQMALKEDVISGLHLSGQTYQDIKSAFKRVIYDFEYNLELKAGNWYSDQWIDHNLSNLVNNLDIALDRWRLLYKSARSILSKATQKIESGTLSLGSDEYKKHKRNQDQATRQLDLLRNEFSGRSFELSEFYPYRYLASEGFLPGYNFTRLPLRIFLPTSDSSGEFISRARSIALHEFGPLNIIYHNGRKYRVSQLVVQDTESSLIEAKISKKAGYFLAGDQKDLEICPFTGLNLGDNANREYLNDLLEMSETRAEEVDRISCEEEERVSRGFEIQTYFSVDGANFDSVKKAVARTDEHAFLNLRFIPAARMVKVSRKWRYQQSDGFPIGLISGNWRSSIPDQDSQINEEYRLVRLWTSTLADALHIEPIQPLGLQSEGVITLQHALKRAIESVFQVESSEIGVVAVGDPEAPNILIYEAAEGSLGILSQFVEDVEVFHKVIEEAKSLCRYEDEEYKGPASYDDLLSYYNQRDHKIIDRHLIQGALDKLSIATIEIQSNTGYRDYEEHYEAILRGLDPNSSTELKFIEYLYKNGLRLPDEAQKRVEGIYVQPDFYYEPRIWVFCDGTPHDSPAVKADDETKRQAIMEKGDEVWVYYYRDNLEEIIAKRPDIFRKVR